MNSETQDLEERYGNLEIQPNLEIFTYYFFYFFIMAFAQEPGFLSFFQSVFYGLCLAFLPTFALGGLWKKTWLRTLIKVIFVGGFFFAFFLEKYYRKQLPHNQGLQTFNQMVWGKWAVWEALPLYQQFVIFWGTLLGMIWLGKAFSFFPNFV